MWLSDISVKRPVFASVISLLLVAFGMLSFSLLPLREFPDINPPIVSINTTYIGASAEVIETREKLRDELVAYCELDTLAMVKIFEVLSAAVG